MNSNPTQKELDELIKLAQEGDDPYEHMDTVKSWVVARNIKYGNVRIRCDFLYADYLDWTKQRPLKFRDFQALMKRHFPDHAHETRKGYLFKLSPEPFDMSQHEPWLIKDRLLKNKEYKYYFKKYARKRRKKFENP